jgi:hypothetical protein
MTNRRRCSDRQGLIAIIHASTNNEVVEAVQFDAFVSAHPSVDTVPFFSLIMNNPG